MKVRVKTTAAVVALFAAVAGTASFAQTVTYNPGDLVIGFQATQSGSTGANQNFLLNLGSAAGYNNGTMPLSLTNPVANIGDQLSSIYGAQWFSRNDLNWGAVGLRQSIAGIGGTGPVVDGDGRGVLYLSKESTGIGESTAWAAYARNPMAIATGNASSMLGGTGVSGGFANQSAYAGTDGLGAAVDAALDNSWSSHVQFGGSTFGIFTNSIEGSVNGNGSGLVYLDIYRLTPDNVAPSWVVTLALDNAGNVYAVPEPSTYAAIIGAAGLALVIARRARRNKATA